MFAAGKTAAVSGAGPDDKFNYVTMLLHGDGTNGAQNNTFLDSSTNNFTITRNGNTTQGSFSPYGSNWSNFFDGTGDYLSTPNVAALQPGTSTNPFCIECWISPSATPASDIAVLGNLTAVSYPTNINGFDILYTSSNQVQFRWGYPNYADSGNSSALVLNTWNHIAVCRNSSGSMSCYLNGTRWFNTSTNTSITNATASSFWVGWAGSLSGTTINPFAGYISNVRLVKGSTPYDPTSSTLTVPTAPLTAITNTSLLTCADNRFIDDSGNGLTMTPAGNTSVQRFNPFGASTAYSTSVIGGSGYFDGSGDSLTTASNANFGFGTGDFTVECWAYPLASTAQRLVFFDNDINNLDIGFSPANTFQYYNGSVNNTGISAASRQWFHFAVSRISGTTSVYINGVRTNNITDSTDTTTRAVQIGNSPSSNPFNGYISDVRIIKGTGIYSGTTITVPTAPLTAITNTKLLLNFTNGAIFDNAMMNDLETVGNAQISTSVVKYGTGSLAFDGTGDYLQLKDTPNFIFGTGDFTIEGWIYLTSSGTFRHIYDQRPTSTDGAYPTLRMNESNAMEYVQGAAVRITSSTLSQSIWYHFALARSGTSTKLFINGTQSGSTYTDSTNYLCGTNRPFVGGSGYHVTTLSMNGYIDDLRITKGFARYTANFTAPTASFSDTGPY